MTGLLGALAERGTQFDSGLTPLLAPRGIATVERGGNTIVYVTAFSDSAITALRLSASGQFQPFATGTLSGVPETALANSLLVVEVDGTEFLIAGKAASEGIASLRIEESGALTPVDNTIDNVILEIGGVRGVLTSLEIGSNTFVFVPGQSDDGIGVFRITSTGQLVNVDNEDDANNALNALDGVYQITAFQAHGTNFLATTGLDEDAVSLFTVSDFGVLTPVSRIADNASRSLDNPAGVVTASLGGFTYLFVSSLGEDAITTLAVSPTGALSVVSTANEPSVLVGPTVMDLFYIDGVPFIAVAGETNDTISVWGIGTDGVLSLITSFTDTLMTAINAPVGIAQVEVDGRIFVLSTGVNDNGISAFEIGADSELLVGDQDGDAIFGLAGQDTLIGERGSDTLNGGEGNDVLLGGLQNDRALGGDGNDLIVGEGGADTLIGGAGVDTLIGGSGADSLRGDDGNDHVVGGGGADTAVGGDGEDTIFGGDGIDSLVGGEDDDRLSGGGSADTIFGGTGNDHLFGGDGKDVLGGGDGNDTLFGADGSDTLNGGANNDRLVGGEGFDKYRTGSGRDVVVVKEDDGRDKILDFQNGADRIDLTDFDLADFNAVNALASAFGPGIIIDFGGGDELIIENFTLAQFNAADVIL